MVIKLIGVSPAKHLYKYGGIRMNGLGKYGASWLKGPWYGSKWITPISRLPVGGTLLVAGRAFGGGYMAGKALDRRFALSNKISDFWIDRTPQHVKWWIHKHF
jgi:hypothetical protein